MRYYLLIVNCLFFSILTFAQVNPQLGTINQTFYIGLNGDDANSGTINQPLATFQEAVNRSPFGTNGNTAYSEIVFLSGHYMIAEELRQACWQYDNGNGFRGVSLRGIHRDSVVLDGSAAIYQSGNFIELLGSGISIKDLTVKLASNTDTTNFWAAIDFKSTVNPCHNNRSNNILIENILIDGCWDHGININETDVVLVKDCEVRHTNLTNINGRNDVVGTSHWGSGIKTRLANDIEIRDCHIHHCWGEGISTARTTNVYVHHNEVHDNFSVNIYLDNVIDGQYSHNLCYGTIGKSTYWRGVSPSPGFGIAAEYYSAGTDFAQCDNVKIFNNIILNCQGVYLDDNRAANEPRTVDFNNIWFCNNSIVGWQGDISAHLRMIRIDFADYNAGYFDMDSIYLFNNLIAVSDSLVTTSGNGQVMSGTNQLLPSTLFYGYNYWSFLPQRFSFYNYAFDNTTDTLNYQIPLQITPNQLQMIQPTLGNGLVFRGQNFPFVTDDFGGVPRYYQNIGALTPDIPITTEPILNENLVTIFPNPTIDYIQVESKKTIGNIQIFNSLGQIILNESSNQTITKVDLSTFENGVYYIKIQSNTYTILKVD